MDDDLKESEAMSALDLVTLQKIFTEVKIESRIVRASEVMPISSLILYLKKDDKDRLISLSLAFMPLPSDLFPDIKLLQFYTELPFDNTKDVSAALIELNRTLPLGGFGLSDAMKIYFRYVHVVKKFDTLHELSDLYQGLLNMIVFVLDSHAGSIERKSC